MRIQEVDVRVVKNLIKVDSMAVAKIIDGNLEFIDYNSIHPIDYSGVNRVKYFKEWLLMSHTKLACELSEKYL